MTRSVLQRATAARDTSAMRLLLEVVRRGGSRLAPPAGERGAATLVARAYAAALLGMPMLPTTVAARASPACGHVSRDP